MVLNRMILDTLRYPRAAAFDHQKVEEFRVLVAWLENTKIRLYKMSDRTSLANIKSPEWDSAFRKYLGDLECPVHYDESNPAAVVAWLVRTALDYDYHDHADEYNSSASQRAARQRHTSRSGVTYPDANCPPVKEALAKLCDQLHVRIPTQSSVQRIEALIEALNDRVFPALDRPTRRAVGVLDLDPGFSTGDAAVDKAATLLRVLFVKDLKRLQTFIDETIVQVQEYTANPKTDSKLGRVGI
eukprot:evm.model.scf_3267.2 EVM.evm.TU.scf_3267.2   scf_3267:6281-12405(+)